MPDFSCTVTRSATATSTTVVDAAFLNAGFAPQVEIPAGTLDASVLDGASFISTFGAAFRAVQFLPWGGFAPESFVAGGTAVVCGDGVRTSPLEHWFVLPSGAAVDALRSVRSSGNTALEGGMAGLQIKGAPSLTAVRAGTYLPPGLCATLMDLSGSNAYVTFSVYVWNNTGASITPALEISTSNASGDEGTVTLRGTVAGTACANAARTRVSFAFDAATLANWQNGARLALRFTVASGQLDVATDYVILSGAQIDKGTQTATALNIGPPPECGFPAGTILPYAGAVAPQGWLLCDGSAVSRTVYAALFQATSTAYGAGDGSSTFNVPDLRGRAPVGAEVAGASQSRMERSVTITSHTPGSDTLTVANTEGLRVGMGGYGSTLTGQTIIALTATTIQLSATVASAASGSVRFSLLGSGDAQALGAAGNGMTGGRRVVTLTRAGCSTNASTTLTVPGVDGIACGMVVSGTGIPAGTTVAALLSDTTVRLSAAATGTASGLTMSFTVATAEGDALVLYQHLLANPTVIATISGATDSDLACAGLLRRHLRAGMSISGPSGAGIAAGTYITGVDPDSGDSFQISPATSGATAASYEVVCSGSTLARESTPPVPDTIPAAVVNYIIKT